MGSLGAHWMLDEIFEQPRTLRATLARYIDVSGFRAETCDPVREWLRQVNGQILIAASGSSRHAGLLAEVMIEEVSGLAVDVEYASEYSYRTERGLGRKGVLVISQSGETADTLAALRRASAAGFATMAVTNVAESTMAREAHVRFPTEAGVERAIPATKSFTAQAVCMSVLALLAAELAGGLGEEQIRRRLEELRTLPEQLEAQLAGWDSEVREVARGYRQATNFLFLGRGVHYPIAREGALKLKESAYLHAEGYPSGELKHGPNALVAEGTPLVMLATVDRDDAGSVERYKRVLQLMEDMREQGADVFAVANRGDKQVAALATNVVVVEAASEAVLPLVEVVPLQLFAYWMAVERGIDVDHPRNLTKAVLAE